MAIVLPMEPGTTGTERETSNMKRAGATVNEETTRVIKAAYRCWMVTVHDQTWKGPNVEHALFRYFVAQKEVCPTSGRLHWQGYIELKDKARLGKVKEVLGCPSAHLEMRRGTQAEAIAYCQKVETRAEPHEKMEFGTKAKAGGGQAGAGKRACGGAGDCYRAALDPEIPYEEALDLIRAGDPRSFLLYGSAIKLNLLEEKKPAMVWEAKYKGCPWLETPEMKRWREEELPKAERAKCLILVGPTRLGKTQWARHLFPDNHMYFRGMTNIRKWRDDAALLVLDDIPWEFIPQKKSLLTQMGEAEVTDKYTPKKTIWVNMPAVVLSNDAPNFGPEDAYWRENAVLAYVDELLYDPDWKQDATPPASPTLWDEDTEPFQE